MEKMNRQTFSILFLLFALPLMSACGRSGGGGTKSDNTDTSATTDESDTSPSDTGSILTGRFMDSKVSGIKYHTASLSGLTTAEGEFSYEEGEVVTFLIGYIVIGAVAGAPNLSHSDLSGFVPPQTGSDVRQAWNQIVRLKQTTPLEVAANIAVFLQTIDEDGDPSNGIEVPAELHRIATEKSLNFNQKMSDFNQDMPLLKLMAESREAGLWGGFRAIRKSLYALDSLYESQNLIPIIKVVSLEDSDDDGDDNGEDNVDSRDTLTYNEKGERILWELDRGGNNTVDWRRTLVFDEKGNQTLVETDTNGDRVINIRQIATHDPNGKQILFEEDSNADSVIDFRRTFIRDRYGNETMIEEDRNGDGTVDWRQTLTRDIEGKITLIEEDNNGDGTVDSRSHLNYDANGNLILWETDQGLTAPSISDRPEVTMLKRT